MAWDRWRQKRSASHPSLLRPLGTALPITNTEREVLRCVAELVVLNAEESLRRIAWSEREQDVTIGRQAWLTTQREQITERKEILEAFLAKVR